MKELRNFAKGGCIGSAVSIPIVLSLRGAEAAIVPWSLLMLWGGFLLMSTVLLKKGGGKE